MGISISITLSTPLSTLSTLPNTLSTITMKFIAASSLLLAALASAQNIDDIINQVSSGVEIIPDEASSIYDSITESGGAIPTDASSILSEVSASGTSAIDSLTGSDS